MFYAGQKEIDQDIEYVNEHGGSYEDQNTGLFAPQMFSLTQDIVYDTTKEKNWTSK